MFKTIFRNIIVTLAVVLCTAAGLQYYFQHQNSKDHNLNASITTSSSSTVPNPQEGTIPVSPASTIPNPPANTVPVVSNNWGLSFRTEGQPPIGNASASDLAQNNAYYLGDTSKKVIYLTFDCGYENGNTGAILDALKKHNAPAAFFVVGNMVKTAPDLIQRMVAEGHIVGNHTYHHPDMSKISDQAAFQKELDDLAALYKETTGQEMRKYYRPPQGKFCEDNLKQAKALGYKTVFWSLAYVDWYTDKQPTHDQAYSKLLPRIHDGAIVLLHSTSKTNAEILDELLTKWEGMGYTFASLDELPDSQQ